MAICTPQISPHISSSDSLRYVHHMVVFQCKSLNLIDVDSPGIVCGTGEIAIPLCNQMTILGAWAVGAQVSLILCMYAQLIASV